MTKKIIDLSQYRNRLKTQVEELTDKAHREIISSLADWFTAEVDEWQSQTEAYKSAILNGSENKTEKETMVDYINHLKKVGRLLYIHNGIEIIRTGGDSWETDADSTKAVLDHILQSLEDI